VLDPDYVRPASVEEAIAALVGAGGDSLIVAGGIVVGSLFNQRLASPAVLVDISRIASLRGIETMPNGDVRLGALVTHEEILRSPILQKIAPLLPETAIEISCPRLRNRGTIGGSVCTIGGQGDPATSLIALQARLEIRGPEGQRVIALEDFYNNPFAVDLDENELLEAVIIPKPADGLGFGFCKLGPRKAMDWTQITVAIVLNCEGNKALRDVRIGMNGVGPTPNRPTKLESFLMERVGAIDWNEAGRVLKSEIEPEDDLIYSKVHKQRLAAVAAKRAVEKAISVVKKQA
jgi:aerobic carbon-monoxide dehydrogenase medium subunit